MEISHKLSIGFLYPFNIVFPFNVILTVSLSKIALQPASHNCPIEMREADVKFGKILASRADSGNSGIGRKTLCVFLLSCLRVV